MCTDSNLIVFITLFSITRSASEEVDVSLLAQKHGGGGHVNAAGKKIDSNW